MQTAEDEIVQVHLHSSTGSKEFQDSTASVDFSLQAPIRAPFSNFTHRSSIEVSLVSVSIPHSFPNITEATNTVTFGIYSNSYQDWYYPPVTTEIDSAEYTVSELAAAVTSAITTEFLVVDPYLPPSPFPQVTNTLTCLFNVSGDFVRGYVSSSSSLATITEDEFNALELVFILKNPNGGPEDVVTEGDFTGKSEACRFINIPRGENWEFALNWESEDYTINTLYYNMALLLDMYIHCSLCNSAISPWSMANSDILCVVPVSQSFGDIEHHTNPDNYAVTIYEDAVTHFRIRLSDHNNRLLQLGDVDWSMSIQFKIKKNKMQSQNDTRFRTPMPSIR